MNRLITATFRTRTAAEHAMQEISKLNINPEQISMIVTDETRGNSFDIETHSKMDQGTAWGASIGGLLGMIAGAVFLSTGSVVIPSLDVVVMGSAISALVGLGAGAAFGGLIGALAGSGISEYEAIIYHNEAKKGGVLIAIEAENDNQQRQLREILSHENCYSLAA